MTKKLNNTGIITVRQLATASEDMLYKRLGVHGPRLQKIVRGELDYDVVTDEERPEDKSIGNSRTFGLDSSDPEELKGYLLSLVGMVGRRLREAELAGRTVTLTIRYGDFHTVTHQSSQRRATNDEDDIFRIAWRLFQKFYITDMPVRLLGVSVSHLAPSSKTQMDLFDREKPLHKAVDKLRDKYGESIVRRSSTMNVRIRKAKHDINFARPTRKEQQRRTG
jgi:DNA polymerase-4